MNSIRPLPSAPHRACRRPAPLSPARCAHDGARRIGAEQFMRFGLVGGDRHRGKVGIFEASGSCCESFVVRFARRARRALTKPACRGSCAGHAPGSHRSRLFRNQRPRARHHRQCAAGDRLGGARHRHDCRFARRPMHRHCAGARPGAHRRALRGARRDYAVKAFQTGAPIAVRGIAVHPRFDPASYAASRATADIALIKLATPLTDLVRAGSPRGRAPRHRRRDAYRRRLWRHRRRHRARAGRAAHGKLTVTGKPGSLQIRLFDPATRNQRAGLGACTGDSGAPCSMRERRGRPGDRHCELVHRAGRRRRLRRPDRRDAAAALPRLDRRAPRRSSIRRLRHNAHFPQRVRLSSARATRRAIAGARPANK